MSIQTWFYNLVSNQNKSGLLDKYQLSELNGKVVVCQSTEKGRRFRLFNNYLELNKFLNPEKNKNLYEVILGEYAQKPHFDIDIPDQSVNGEEVISDLVKSIQNAFKIHFSLELKLEDILLYTSTGSKIKQSYHLLINKVCQSSNEECKRLYEIVIEFIKPEFKEFIDSAVYSNRQQFRLLGNSKFGSDRVKIFLPIWNFNGKNIIFKYDAICNNSKIMELYDLQNSLISDTAGCTFLPSLCSKKTVVFDFEDYDLQVIKKFLDNYDPNFNIIKQDKNMILLKRLKCSFCNMCGRNHDSENPFLSIIDNKIFINCRRSNSRELIGSLLDKSPVKEIVLSSVLLSGKDILKKLGEIKKENKKVFDDTELMIKVSKFY